MIACPGPSIIEQAGSGNGATVTQTASGNTSHIDQLSDGNTATVDQSATGPNTANVNQDGVNSFADIQQRRQL